MLLDEKAKIVEVMLCGDYLLRPLEGDDIIADSLVGLQGTDFEGIKKKITQTARAIGFEAIMMNPEEFAIPIVEACRKALAERF